jgi:hypothetical protein
MNTYTVKILVKDSEGEHSTFTCTALGSIIHAMKEVNRIAKDYDILDVNITKEII